MKSFFYFIFLVCFTFLCLELLLGVYYKITNTKTTLVWQEEPGIGRRTLPNQEGWFVTASREYKTYIETNSQGWRDSEHTKDKPQNAYRIAILGDSFVENYQVDLYKTFFKQLENKLLAQNKKVEVAAFGLGDTGTAQQYKVLQKYVLDYKPDLVIHIFFSGNDVKNNSRSLNIDPHRPYFELENSELIEIDYAPRQSTTAFFKKHSLLVETLLDAKGKLLTKPIGYPIDYQIYDQDYSDEYTRAWEVTKKLILESKNKVEQNEGEYLLVITANNEQLNKNLIEQISKKYSEFKNADLEKPDKILNEFCNNEKIDCLFLLPEFKEFVAKNPEKPTHFFYDGHWTQTGADLVASLLFNQIISKY